jgi:hypothetical protein
MFDCPIHNEGRPQAECGSCKLIRQSSSKEVSCYPDSHGIVQNTAVLHDAAALLHNGENHIGYIQCEIYRYGKLDMCPLPCGENVAGPVCNPNMWPSAEL